MTEINPNNTAAVESHLLGNNIKVTTTWFGTKTVTVDNRFIDLSLISTLMQKMASYNPGYSYSNCYPEVHNSFFGTYKSVEENALIARQVVKISDQLFEAEEAVSTFQKICRFIVKWFSSVSDFDTIKIQELKTAKAAINDQLRIFEEIRGIVNGPQSEEFFYSVYSKIKHPAEVNSRNYGGPPQISDEIRRKANLILEEMRSDPKWATNHFKDLHLRLI